MSSDRRRTLLEPTGGGVPAELVQPFKNLWTEMMGYAP